MNMGRFFSALGALALVVSLGCSQPDADNGDQQNPPPVTTDMEIVVPESEEAAEKTME